MSETAGSTTQTNQQSSSDQSQSTSSDQGNGGSNLTQTTRPDYVPEAYWDAGTNAVKGQEFSEYLGKLSATQAAHDARLAARPEKPEGYELKFADDFKPEVPIKFDETDPRIAAVRAYAHENGIDQAGFSKLLQIDAARVIAEEKAYQAAVEAETKKLGPNATALVTALKTWLTGHLGAEAANDLLGTDNTGGLLIYSAAAVRHLEKLQKAMTSQGAAPHVNGGREPPAPPPKTLAEAMWPNMQGKAS